MENKIEAQEDRAEVIEIYEGEILIEIQKSGSCKSCAISGVCGGQDRSFRHRIKTDMKLEKGDIIEVSISSGVKLMSSFIVFIMPVLAMILFYFLAKYAVKLTEDFSILASFCGLLLSGILIYILDKKFASKIHFEIIGKVKNENTFT
jgi:positive regulator of sigma E activity